MTEPLAQVRNTYGDTYLVRASDLAGDRPMLRLRTPDGQLVADPDNPEFSRFIRRDTIAPA